MEILSYDPSMLPELTSAYNRMVAGTPHCYPVRPETFASALAGIGEDGAGPDRLHSEAVTVALENTTVLGFIHTAVERPEKDDGDEHGVIRFAWYEAGCRPAGQALLEAAEGDLRRRDMPRIIAFDQDHRYPFYHLGPAFLSDRMGQVHALMGFNGYARSGGEVFLDWPDYEPVAPVPADVSADISVHVKKGHGILPDVIVKAHRDGKEIGECGCVSCGEFSHPEDAQDWLFTEWLGVADEMQGKGLGRHLLQRALHEMHAIGYRHASISTSWNNHRAFLFYSNYGYRVVDWTYGVKREI